MRIEIVSLGLGSSYVFMLFADKWLGLSDNILRKGVDLKTLEELETGTRYWQ